MNPQIRELDEPATKNEANFVETALKLGGASEEEAKKTGALDRADEQVEDLFAKKYQTAGSPAHRAVWDKEFPIELFSGQSRPASAAADEVMRKSIEVVRRRQKDGTLMNEQQEDHRRRRSTSWRRSVTGACWSSRNTADRALRSAPSPGSSSAWAPSSRRSPVSPPFTAASVPSTRCVRSARRSKRRTPSQTGPRRTRLGVRPDGTVPPAPT